MGDLFFPCSGLVSPPQVALFPDNSSGYFLFFSWQVLVLVTQVLCLGKQLILEALSLARQVFIAFVKTRDCYV